MAISPTLLTLHPNILHFNNLRLPDSVASGTMDLPARQDSGRAAVAG
jgi:hypothetical protein